MTKPYTPDEPTRDEVDAFPGGALLEFGTNWCGWCQGAQPRISEALRGHESLRHIKVEDGPGRPLGRSFRVKLWPTLIFLRDGREVERLVRPGAAEPIREAVERIDPVST
ncbi:thioredoxin family protein [Ramlibacter sp. AW1]|uniref:Thioredoxin family protein n=1 Tax=Ramlibacter aurantiacus TaxID=2801330 RepID=A0A936ZS70_9BURK|nr:thioredoxin family protein [Ramlibacter aurantiacus]MBL0420135.1 thioredoxin family protein [Ramlibacter aurantiacus]